MIFSLSAPRFTRWRRQHGDKLILMSVLFTTFVYFSTSVPYINLVLSGEAAVVLLSLVWLWLWGPSLRELVWVSLAALTVGAVLAVAGFTKLADLAGVLLFFFLLFIIYRHWQLLAKETSKEKL